MKSKTYANVQGLLQGTLWFCFAGFVAGVIVFPFFDMKGKISPLAALVFMGCASFFGGLFQTIGGIVSARKDYLDNKLKLDPRDEEKIAGMAAQRNPWLIALQEGAIQWPLFGLLAFGLCFGIFSNGLSQIAFGLCTALLCLINGAILVHRTCIRELLKFIAHPTKNPPSFHRYLWNEHLLGNGIANLVINFMFGYIVFHQGPKNNFSPLVQADFFVVDSIGMSFVIALGVGFGGWLQASTDLRAGRALAPVNKFPRPNLILRLAAFPLLAVLFIFGPKLVFMIFGADNFTILEAMSLKGILACALAMISPALAARWSAPAKTG